ncbi:MAG: hypothetical protein Kow0068_08820 [Marinilabiliales bacterium]
MRNTFILIFLLFSISIFCQPEYDKSQLALKYYQDKEYDKAATVYYELFRQTNNSVYFSYYVNCLVQTNKIDEAIKETKRQKNRQSDYLYYTVELGYLYKQKGDLDKSKEQYEDAINKVLPLQNQIIALANYFISHREFAYAEKTYLYGRKLFKGQYSFNYELAMVYRYMRDFEKMINEYLDLLLIHDSYIQSVQNNLQAAIYNEDEEDLINTLKSSLLQRIQKYPEKTVYNEMLIWLYLQEKDFQNAFYQTKALDKRKKEGGKRLIALGEIAMQNEEYDVASKCYQYVIDLGDYGLFYIDAKGKYLEALNKKITSNYNYTKQDIIKLENAYNETINELGKSAATFNLLIGLAHIKAFYRNQPDEALDILNEAIKIPGVSNKQLNEAYLEKGDIELFSGEPWDAALTYAKVEKNNESNPIGSEAKFRKAKLAYYTGDFKWAQAQLDVLKASTSKLIANDAFELSSLIADNLSEDTTENALKLFAKADLLEYQNKDSLAILTLDSINKLYPYNSLNDDVIFRKAKIELKHKNYELAADYFKEVVDNYPYDILADNALYHLANLYEKYFNDKEKAMEYYKQLMFNYPGSIFIIDARNKYRTLRGDKTTIQEKNEFDGI